MSRVPVGSASLGTPESVGSREASASLSAASSEKNARLFPSVGNTASISATTSTSAPNQRPKLRSCVACRTRKVRCDKRNPCSNCYRAKIACVIPSNDRPPRWARRLERITNNADASQNADPDVSRVMERLHNLEGLVKDLSGQLEQARASPNVHSPESSVHDRAASHDTDASMPAQMVIVDDSVRKSASEEAGRTSFVSKGLWSRVHDELDGLKIDSRALASDDFDTSDDETSLSQPSSTQELNRTPLDRHQFLFRQNLTSAASDLKEFHPLPSQIPFLLNVYSENVNAVIHVVHIPTVTKMIRDLRHNQKTALTSTNEALMFAIYYSAITSMEEDEIMTNFGTTKAELNMKFRLGLELALAKADFLNSPNIVLVQAFTIFLFLARRYDSPRFVWMMTGLAIRMAQALGLHRDGSHFKHLTPFEVEMRRRTWWALCMLDGRSSEDQGSDMTITYGNHDTKLPLNINDADIDPETKETPIEGTGMTDMSFALVSFEISKVIQEMMAPGSKDKAPSLEEQSNSLSQFYENLDRKYLQYSSELGESVVWAASTAFRLVISKMRLLIFLPLLFSSPNGDFSENIRTEPFIAAIEVAEFNHTLHSETACRQWRWTFETYTHWNAIVYLLIEISRRQWSPTVERAWVALHSSWLIPSRTDIDKNSRIWVPLRRLMVKVRKHREAELDRLRGDLQAAERLEIEDSKISAPASRGLFSSSDSTEFYRRRWRKLVAGSRNAIGNEDFSVGTSLSKPSSGFVSAEGGLRFSGGFDSVERRTQLGQAAGNPGTTITNGNPSSIGSSTDVSGHLASGQNISSPYNSSPSVPPDWPSDNSLGPGTIPWLWNDTDPSVERLTDVNMDSLGMDMDLDADMNWHDWVESARGMDWPGQAPGGGWT